MALVPVIYSPDFGAGWYTWNTTTDTEVNPCDREVAAAIEAGDNEALASLLEEKYPDSYNYGLLSSSAIMYLEEGTKFIFDEYDGAESIVILDEIKYCTAR